MTYEEFLNELEQRKDKQWYVQPNGLIRTEARMLPCDITEIPDVIEECPVSCLTNSDVNCYRAVARDLKMPIELADQISAAADLDFLDVPEEDIPLLMKIRADILDRLGLQEKQEAA